MDNTAPEFFDDKPGERYRKGQRDRITITFKQADLLLKGRWPDKAEEVLGAFGHSQREFDVYYDTGYKGWYILLSHDLFMHDKWCRLPDEAGLRFQEFFDYIHKLVKVD